MPLFSELRNRETPWLTQGWRYYPDPVVMQALDAIEAFTPRGSSFYDLGFIRKPADRLWMLGGGQVEQQRE